jgi:hypothetical protein
MGGPGSGNWYRFDSKSLVDHYMSIDVLQLSRKVCLEPGQRYFWKLQNGCKIAIETKPDAIELFYGISRNGSPREDIHITVPLSWSSCNYGGKRPWFICPGKDCGRRVAKLYMGDKYFLCRHCYDLAYPSQRERKEFRLLNEAQKICERLGSNNYDDLCCEPKPKPKGMHWATYNKLIHEAEDLNHEAMRIMMNNS